MVHKEPRSRGRPRAYNPDEALAAATAAFWRLGFSGASVDQLSDATDMNRPSMYAAFGDKRALYLKTLDRYIEQSHATVQRVLDYDRPLGEVLRNFYKTALAAYLPDGERPRGCYLIGTAATEAVMDPEVRAKLRDALDGIEHALVARIAHARKLGQLAQTADPAALGMVASAILYSLAVRSRAGDPRPVLESLIDAGVALIASPSRDGLVSKQRPTRGPRTARK
jgi:AcrR family transcriptional regulator